MIATQRAAFPRRDRTVRALLDRYVRERDMAAGTLTPKSLVNHLTCHFGALEVERVDRYHYAEYFKRHLGKRSPATLSKELARLSAAIRYARDNWRECQHLNEPPRFEARTSEPRMYVWTPEQIAAILEEARKLPFDEGLAIAIAAHTGARFGAVNALTWDRINFQREKIDFRIPGAPQTRKRNHPALLFPIGLIPWLQEGRKVLPGLFLFTKRPDRYRTALAQIVGKLHLPPGSFHTFRHSWATNALAKGMTVHGVAQALCMSPAMVVKVYGKADRHQVIKAATLY